MSTAAGPGGGAALEGVSVAPPLIFPPVEPAPAAPTDSREHSQRKVDAGQCARLPALIAELPSPDREIVLLRVVAGVSVSDIVAALGVAPAAVHLAQHQALTALQPAATANGPPPAARVRVVLLPHGRTEPADTDPNNCGAGRANGMNQDGSSRHHLAESDGSTRAIAASRQWHDVELALKVARHSFDRWLVADHEDPPSRAVMHAYHTHETLHEAARVITVLIETFRAEVAASIPPARGADIPTQCR
ncbi:MAG: sigma factor-like helix-turn-helix DNA-binding protein [Pseudonocardiaceae bacterium]